MGQLNNCFFAGYVGRDAETKDTKSGDVTSFPLCYTEKGKNGAEDRLTWVRIVAFKGYTGDRAKTVKKGQNVFVTGRLTVSPYKAKDGSEKVDVSIIANNIEILVKPEAAAAAGGRGDPDFSNPNELPF